jgi:hypothetical protein
MQHYCDDLLSYLHGQPLRFLLFVPCSLLPDLAVYTLRLSLLSTLEIFAIAPTGILN